MSGAWAGYAAAVHRIDSDDDVAAGVRALIEREPRFREVRDVAGRIDLRRRAPGFEGLVWIITGQMISLGAAEAIWGRTRAALGGVEAARVLEVDDAVLRAAGQSRAKVVAMREAARAVVDGSLDFRRVAALGDEEGAEELMRVRGVGAWTAAMYLLACEGRSDVWPCGDVALRTAVGRAIGFGRRVDEGEMIEIGEVWRPWRAVAARVLWGYYRRLGELEA